MTKTELAQEDYKIFDGEYQGQEQNCVGRTQQIFVRPPGERQGRRRMDHPNHDV